MYGVFSSLNSTTKTSALHVQCLHAHCQLTAGCWKFSLINRLPTLQLLPARALFKHSYQGAFVWQEESTRVLIDQSSPPCKDSVSINVSTDSQSTSASVTRKITTIYFKIRLSTVTCYLSNVYQGNLTNGHGPNTGLFKRSFVSVMCAPQAGSQNTITALSLRVKAKETNRLTITIPVSWQENKVSCAFKCCLSDSERIQVGTVHSFLVQAKQFFFKSIKEKQLSCKSLSVQNSKLHQGQQIYLESWSWLALSCIYLAQNYRWKKVHRCHRNSPSN